MTFRARFSALAAGVLFSAAPAAAQREGYAYLSWVGPEVSLVSIAEDDASARPNTPILAGDRLNTGPSSRAEAILADGNVLRVDVQTSLRFDRLARTYEAEDVRNSIYVERGAVSLEHFLATTREEATRIDTNDVTVLFPDAGLLRVETGRRGTEVYVVSGRAEVYARSGRATLRAGQYSFASGDFPLEIDRLDVPRDRFTRFVEERRALATGLDGGESALAGYEYDWAVADFGRWGSWITVDGVRAFRPSVAVGWRPYVDGYWRWSPVGLTWVSYEPWGWLPYHYGTWVWDPVFGWCWIPGHRYSPAWVYWTYTPSWIGWCPIGYYGGYYGGYHGPQYRTSHRYRHGAERWTHAYPHLRGPVDVTRIDPRGWSYTTVSRLGTRLDARRDVLGHERVGFRPGERGLVATTPLRIDRGRGGPVTTVVQDAVRRVPQALGAEGRGGGGAPDMTPILRRDGTLGTTETAELRRSFVTPGQDPGYRPVPAEEIAAPRREGSTAASSSFPSRGGGTATGPGPAALPPRGAEVSAPRRDTAPRETWRDGGTASPDRPVPTGEAAPGRARAPELGGGFGREAAAQGDDGWSSPGGGTRTDRPPSRTFDVPSRQPVPADGGTTGVAPPVRRETAPEPDPSRSAASQPARPGAPPRSGGDSPPAGRREAPAPHPDEGWRGATVPRSAPAPAPEASGSRAEPAPARHADVPRSAPAPRPEASSVRSSEPPRSAPASRSGMTSPSRSADVPRSAPAPRSEAPPSRPEPPPSSGSTSGAPPPPPSSSNPAPPRSASPRG